MPRETHNLVNEVMQLATNLRFWVDANILHAAGKLVVTGVAFDMFGQRVDSVERQTQRFADVTNGAANSIRDHGRRQPRPFTSILVVQILKDLLAPLMFEIDINIWCFVPLLTDKPLEQQVSRVWIDRSDTKTVTDGGVSRRASALAEDPTFAGEADKVPDS